MNQVADKVTSTGAKAPSILLVDDDPNLLKLLTIRLENQGYDVHTATNGLDALQQLKRFRPQVVITDLRMDQIDGMELLQKLPHQYPGLPVIVITAHGSIPDAVEAIQHGAFAFLTKPIDKDELFEKLEKALLVSQPEHGDSNWRDHIISKSPGMERLLGEVQQVAQSQANVLIRGESGSGKELLASALHRASNVAQGPFVAINCGAIPEHLLESELFGYKKGAFTGADRDKSGLMAEADGGTLFLDEIGDMPMALQVKLLRVLQERKVRPVGSTEEIHLNVRVVSATHQDLQDKMDAGEFREDLYYRLKVVELLVPPLRERREDIPLLANHFLTELAAREQRSPKVYTPEAMELLVGAPWAGNVRQLQNIVEQNVALATTSTIPRELVAKALGKENEEMLPFKDARDSFIEEYLVQLLQLTQGNVSQAAKKAQRNRTDFYKLLNKYSLDPKTFKTSKK